jgi:hypothetical protein
MSGGMVMTVSDVEAGTSYLDACAGGTVPKTVSGAWAQAASELLHWLTGRGVDPHFRECGQAEHPDLFGASAITVHQPGSSIRLDPAAGAGRALYDALSGAIAAEPNIQVEWNSPAERLLKNAAGEVCGVLARGREWRSRYGVVLTTGGFEMNPAMKAEYLPAYPTYFYGSPANTGDGVRMAMAAGADLWHMNLLVGRAVGNFELAPGHEQAFLLRIAPPGYLITERRGNRFANEDSQARLSHSFYYELLGFDSSSLRFPRVPSYWIFDERRRRAGPLTITHIGACAVGLYDWSDDNSREVERGWISRGGTVAEAAALAGIEDPAQTERTVSEFNSGCLERRDALGRSPDSLVAIDSPPFYCVPLWPGGSNTSGGPRRDEHARVLDPFGLPMPGLFAAGELGQPIGRLYPADGANLSEALCFGRVAAQTALKGREHQ